MPRLLIFAPCERVILGQGDNSASLIVVIQQLQFHLPKGQEIPKDAGAAARFAIFSQWHKSAGDEGKTFEQRILFVVNDEKTRLEAVMEFQMPDRLYRLIANINVMPVLQPGEYSLKLFVREKGEREWGEAVADYPIEVVHIDQLQPQ
jgi:hypothetical protein